MFEKPKTVTKHTKAVPKIKMEGTSPIYKPYGIQLI